MVTRITPFAARAPYMAAEASFSTEIDSMSSGLRRLNERSAIPSTTISGEVFPKVPFPRIRMSAPSSPGSPERVLAMIPAVLPARVLLKLAAETFLISSPLTDDTEPVRVAFFCVP